MRELASHFRRITACGVLWLLSSQPAAALTLVLVTNSNGSLTAEETARRTQFQNWGYTVTGNCDFGGRIDEVRLFNRAVTCGGSFKIYQESRAPGIRLIRWVETR